MKRNNVLTKQSRSSNNSRSFILTAISILATALILLPLLSQAQFSCPSGTKYKEYMAYSNAFTSAVGVDHPEFSLGYPESADVAKLDAGETMTFVLNDNVVSGDTIYFWATSDHNDDPSNVRVSVSADNSNYSATTNITVIGNDKNIVKYSYIVNHAPGASYVRIRANSGEDLLLAGVGYTKWACAQLCSGMTFTYNSGTSTSYVSENSIGNKDKGVGLPDGDKAEWDNTTDFYVLDLGTIVPAGTHIQLYLSHEKDDKPGVTFQVTSSNTNGSFTNSQSFTTQVIKDANNQHIYQVTNTTGVRYLRFVLSSAPQKGYLDGIKYAYPTFKTGRSYIKGLVFNDVNNNGVQNGAEAGIAGIKVELYNDVNSNGVLDVNDSYLQFVNTTAGGNYSFELSNISINYITKVDVYTLPASTVMTTDNRENASFTGLNQYDCNNNFGYRNCGGSCPPTAYDDNGFFKINTPLVVDVLDNDFGDLEITSVTVNSGGLLAPSNGTVTADAAGNITYTPDFNFTGIDSFQYQVCANFAPFACDVATVTVNSCTASPSENILGGIVFFEVLPDNSAYDSNETSRPNVTVRLYNDANCNGTINAGENIVASTTSDADGYYSFNVGTGCFITVLDLTSSNGDYTASLINKKSTSFNTLGNCNNTLHLGVRASVDAIDDIKTSVINNQTNIDVLSNDIGVLDPLLVTTTGLIQPTNGTTVVNANGTITYTPDWDFEGTDVFQYRVCSDDDAAVCDIATVTINVTCPSVNGQNTIYGSLFEDNNISSVFDEGEYWTYPNLLDINLYTDANNNGLVDGPDVLVQTVSTDVAGNYYFNVANSVGDYLIQIDKTNKPGAANITTPETQAVTFSGTNQADCGYNFGFAFCGSTCPPIARDDAATISAGTAAFLNVLTNDFDLDGNIVISSLKVIQKPANASVINNGNGQLIFAPNGSFIGIETFTYVICDDNLPSPLCDTAVVTMTITDGFDDPCAQATKEHTFYLPYPAENLYDAFRNATSCPSNLGNVLRSVTSIKSPYPGTIITWDHWEDGYEADIKNPVQSTTQIWGDKNLDNGVVPGYPNDFIPSVGNVVLDNEMIYSTRDLSHIVFDAKDKIHSSGDIALSLIAGDNSPSGSGTVFAVQAAKTDVYDLNRFGTSFTVPFGENLGNEFKYTSLFARAAYENSIVSLDIDNDNIIDTIFTLNEGEVFFLDGGVQSGATISSTKPVGVDVLFGGIDCFGTRQVNLLPGAFYADKYYTPVPTTLGSAPAAVYLYNSLESSISVNWTSNVNSGVIVVPGKTTVKHLLTDNSAYRFHNLAGQSFTAIEVIDSDANGSTYDWSFNLISEPRLTNFASIAWAPGSLTGSGNYNPVWVTPTANTTIYIKYNGDLSDKLSLQSPCNIPYDLAIPLNELNYYEIYDNSDNDQSGVAIYTCDGTPISAVYGENPFANGSTTPAASPAMDVGTTIQPMCLQQLIIAVDDEVVCQPNDFVVIDLLDNDFSFLATIDITSLSNTGLLQASNGSVVLNGDGTVTYTANPGWSGIDTFEYNICSFEYPDLCDIGTIYVNVTNCNATPNENLVNGYVYLEQLVDNGVYNGEARVPGVLVHLIGDTDCDGQADPGELIIETVATDASGAFSFSTINGEFVKDNFDDPTTLNDGNDGSLPWDNAWQEIGESNGFATNPVSVANDPSDGDRALIISGASKGASRIVEFNGATNATVKFEFRRQNLNNAGEELQVRFNGNTIYVINDGNGIGTNPYYIPVSISIPYGIINPNGDNTISFVTNASTANDDYFYFDNVEVIFNKAQVCFVVEVDVTDKNDAYELADLNEASASFSALGTCANDKYLGILANIIAEDNNSIGEVNMPQTIDILSNDIGKPNPTSIVITGQPNDGTVTVNPDGTVIYTPDPGFQGSDDFDYQVCSVEDPSVCDEAKVDVTVSCSVVSDSNTVAGVVFNDFNENGIFDAGEALMPNVTVNIYRDLNQNGILDGTEANTPIVANTAGGNFKKAIVGPFGPVTNKTYSVALGIDDAHEKLSDGSVDLGNSKLEMKSDKVYSGMRFTGIDIPKDATILSAHLTFTASDDRSDPTNLVISVQNSDVPNAFTSTINNVSSRWNGAHTVNWNNVEVWVKDNQHNSPDITSLVQYMVDKNAWNSGDNMAFILKWVQGERKARSYDESSAVAPKLNITYQVVDYPITYITKVDENTLPYGGRITTSQVNKTYTFLSESDCNINIGVARNTTATVNDVNVTFQNIPVSGNVMRNDLDIEGSSFTFSNFLVDDQPISSGVSIQGKDLNGQTVANAGTFIFNNSTGNYNFIPANNFTGIVDLKYFKCDAGLPAVCDTGSLTISVKNFPNPNDWATNNVEAVNDYNTSSGNTVIGNLIKNDGDPEGDEITLTDYSIDVYQGGVIHPGFNQTKFISGYDEYGKYWDKAGSIKLQTNGNYTFTPFVGFVGTVALDYTICDNAPVAYRACDNAQLIIEVLLDKDENGNDAPFAGDDFVTTIANTAVYGDWLDNDGDDNSDLVRFNTSNVNINPLNPSGNTQLGSYTTQEGGNVVFYKNGTFKYSPATDFYGPDQIAYRICDVAPISKCDSATIYFLTSPIYYDYGDLPEQFPSAGHMIPIDFDQDVRPDLPMSIWFGEIVDHEIELQGNQFAQGDNDAGSNDEDGLVFPRYAKLGQTVDFEIKINSKDPFTTVYYGLWFDWDFDGTFDDFYSGSGVTPSDDLRAIGSLTVSVALPNESEVPTGEVGIRLRAFQTMPNASQHSGNFRAGEVEDYIMYQYRGTSLPVELSFFNAKAVGNDGILTWQTETEINNDYFSVQRSTDAVNWEEIGIVEGYGTSNEVHNYEYQDLDLASNIYYYRLQQFDYDGTNEYSDIKSIAITGDNQTVVNKITVFPNPVQSNGQLNINGVQNEMIDVIIYSINGSEKANFSLPANLTIDMSRFDLKSGTYILQIKDGDYIQSDKIIVFE